MPRTRTLLVLVGLALAALAAGPAAAQPYDSFIDTTGGADHGYVRIPHSSALNPTGAFTFMIWFRLNSHSSTGENCRSIAGKDFLEAWWIGVCNVGGVPTLRSYLRGGASSRNGGEIPIGFQTHVAVTHDGVTRRHYINGELVASFADAGALGTSSDEMRIGSDVSWPNTPDALWDQAILDNVALSTSTIRAQMRNPTITGSPTAGYNFNGNANDITGNHNGSLQGAGISFTSFSTGGTCSPSGIQACLSNRFSVNIRWRDGGGNLTLANVVPGVGTLDSKLFYFIDPNNWEFLVKTVNGCGLNSRWWFFVSASTEQFYRLVVFDHLRGIQRIYYGYGDPNQPAITDTSAIAGCP